MIVLDASVLIAFLDSNDEHHEAAVSLLESSGAEPLSASTISLAEVLVAPAKAGRLDEATTALERLGVTELPVGESSARQLAEIRARTGLKMPDCCVLAAARNLGASVATFDKALAKAASGENPQDS
jgi:predicted nucleic acid-binding protein